MFEERKASATIRSIVFVLSPQYVETLVSPLLGHKILIFSRKSTSIPQFLTKSMKSLKNFDVKITLNYYQGMKNRNQSLPFQIC